MFIKSYLTVVIVKCTLCFILLLQLSCSSAPLNTQLDPSWQIPDLSDYKNVIKKNTYSDKKYDGFTNLFDISVTKLNQDIRIKQLKLKANYGQWDIKKADQERSKLIDSMAKESMFFISFFSPKRDLNNLQMKETGWSATLEINGTKYPGKLKSYGNKFYKLENLYEHHTLWHKGYSLKFKIPSAESDTAPQTLTLASPYGYVIFKYNK